MKRELTLIETQGRSSDRSPCSLTLPLFTLHHSKNKQTKITR